MNVADIHTWGIRIQEPTEMAVTPGVGTYGEAFRVYASNLKRILNCEFLNEERTVVVGQEVGEGSRPNNSQSLSMMEKDGTTPLSQGCGAGDNEDSGFGEGDNVSGGDETEPDDSNVVAGDAKGLTDNNPHEVYVGMIFVNRGAFKVHMSVYAIYHKLNFRNARSTPNLMVLQCTEKDCEWRVYAAKDKDSDWYQIRKAKLVHSCTVNERSAFQERATTTVIGGLMRSRYNGGGVGPRPNELRDLMRDKHEVPISYWKAWRAREIAREVSAGTNLESYNLLPNYLQRLVHANPGTIVAVETSYEEGLGYRFKYLFFSLGASIQGMQYMRRVIVIDGTHLKGKYQGCLVTASAQDGNYQIFPLAFAIVDGENDQAWSWFFDKLSAILPYSIDLVFVSDRHNSIYAGLRKVYPQPSHCACVVHLQRNIHTHFKKRHLGYLVSKAARSFTRKNFERHFAEIRKLDESCAEYLIGIGLGHWTRSYFLGDRYNIMTSNLVESLNAALSEAREFPIVPLVEFIRSTLMRWFYTRREAAEHVVGQITNKAQAIVSRNFEMGTGFVVRPVNDGEYEVIDMVGVTHHVDLKLKTCSC